MQALSDAVSYYKRTPEFTRETIPKGFCKAHQTKESVWGKIVVTEGQLEYTIDATDEVVVLDPDTPGIIEPAVLHRVVPLGEVRFHVEFYR